MLSKSRSIDISSGDTDHSHEELVHENIFVALSNHLERVKYMLVTQLSNIPCPCMPVFGHCKPVSLCHKEGSQDKNKYDLELMYLFCGEIEGIIAP